MGFWARRSRNDVYEKRKIVEDENLKGLLTLLITVNNLKEEKESWGGRASTLDWREQGIKKQPVHPLPKSRNQHNYVKQLFFN